jgi:hypothetical protein
VDSAIARLPAARNRLKAEWAAAYGTDFDAFWADCERVKGWPTLSGWEGESIAEDPRLAGRLGKLEKPRSMQEVVEPSDTHRRRSNSLSTAEGGQQKNVQQAFDKAAKHPRSFIRTWVRIVPWSDS